MLPLSFITNYDGITVLKRSANRAIISTKDFVLRSSSRVSTLLRRVPLSFFIDYYPLLVR